VDKLNVAIIMDGNGRWAESKGKKRSEGHQEGSEVVRDITTFASKLDEVESLTLYAFSTENWRRPKYEVDFLMRLLSKYLDNELDTYLKNGVRFRAVGDISKFSPRLQKSIEKLERETKDMRNLTQNLALNYGGKDEIVRGVKKLLKNGEEISEESIQRSLDLEKPVDILIRTGGDHRISNFLLWHIAYAELFFTDTLFPDFGKDEFKEILEDFKSRDRRFGGLNS
jgi:undecaprenyl diphosphate synthase